MLLGIDLHVNNLQHLWWLACTPQSEKKVMGAITQVLYRSSPETQTFSSSPGEKTHQGEL